VVERASLPDELEITAETSDGVIMGLQHKRYPVHGVQFHPESIASEHGHQLLSNFLDLARVERRTRGSPQREAARAL
jgi:anthranilate synthase component 2